MIPRYLTFCIRQALFRPGEPVPTRLGYLVTCADAAGLVGRVGSQA